MLSRTSLLILALVGLPAQATVPAYYYELVKTYPHDTGAFTEGLFYLNGFLYESTGLEGHSSVRKVKLETGQVLQKADISPELFGEGITWWDNRLLSLTWKNHFGFVFNLGTFAVQQRYSYEGEGW